eukprot:CCRYP_010335-RA/>CCRYP_010335-RA protein AED:0.59 eAED:0.59 QI:0/-1/0/1/-1/0/1/0/208
MHKETIIKELNRLCELGVLEFQPASEWASPTFIIPKKDNTVRFISDFREVNKRLVRKPFPLPKISTVLQDLEGFIFATALDLNMGYYTIRLDPDASKICTIIFPWGKYSYLRLPMGIAGSPDIFQAKMSELMVALEFVRTHPHSRCTSLFVISMCFLGMGKGLPWYGCAPSFNWRETGLQSQSPSFPLNNSSNSCRSSSNLACSGPLR